MRGTFASRGVNESSTFFTTPRNVLERAKLFADQRMTSVAPLPRDLGSAPTSLPLS